MSKKLIVSDAVLHDRDFEHAEVISPAAYFHTDFYQKSKKCHVVNLCKSYQYQSAGYYVSLLAEARGHKVIPSVNTLQDFRFPALIKEDAEDFDELIQQLFKKSTEAKVELMVFFGQTVDSKYAKVGSLLFNLFQVPILKASFSKKEKWSLSQLKTQNLKDLESEEIIRFFKASAIQYLEGKRRKNPSFSRKKYDLAILINPEEQTPPSNPRAIQHFVKAGEKVGFNVDLITHQDFAKLIQYDALFIRETTNVHHHTFKFAKKASAEGLVVMDDPESILKCTNKVYLSELLKTHKIPTPKYKIIQKADQQQMDIQPLSYPVIVKQPDGSFSKGVKKAKNDQELRSVLDFFFQSSELVIAQEFVPTSYDWRVGVLDGEPLYVCQYFMAADHWQIVNWKENAQAEEGDSSTLSLADAPKALLDLAVKASNLIGNGLYGVDIKQIGNQFFIIEINDNPNLDEGVEDVVLKSGLYTRIMDVFMKRILSKQ